MTGNLAETENEYSVYDPAKSNGADRVKLFVLKEHSSAAARAAGALGKVALSQMNGGQSFGRAGDISITCSK